MKISTLAARTALASALLAVTGVTIAATPGYTSRQERMDAAYDNYRKGTSSGQYDPSRNESRATRNDDLRATGNVKEDAKRFGRGMKRGAKHTGHAIAEGSREAGHAVVDGAKDAGHAVADGARKTGRAAREAGRDVKDKVTGKD